MGTRTWMAAALLAWSGWLAQAHAAPPAAEPNENTAESAPPSPPVDALRDETKGEEADYLALADAPLFLPRSYLYWGTPVGRKGARVPLRFGLEYALHLPIYSNVRDAALFGRPLAFAVTLSFEGALRMLASESNPVRMPSYRPNTSGQVFYIFHRPQPVLVGFRTSIFHYSNGQERCTFDEHLSDESAACVAASQHLADPARALNRKSGNFSTNGWLTELHARIHQVNTKGVAIAHLALGASLEGMLRRGPGAMPAELRHVYGWGHVGGELDARKRFGWAVLAVHASGKYYPHSGAHVPTAAGSVEIVIGPYWLTGLGFFARYYGGRDFYNAFFVDRLQQFCTGLAWDGERPLKFKR